MKFKLLKIKKKSQKNTANLNKKRREKSRGRSMVEMLGVLAIIGVLSIGGIQGYTIAMRKHRANEILNAMQKYATVIYTNCQTHILNSGENETLDVNYIIMSKTALNCPRPVSYLQAGIGGYPSGVRYVTLDDYADDHWTFIRSDSSGDFVRFYVGFESKELCQSVLNAAGIVPTDLYGRNASENNHPALGDCSSADAMLSFIMN